MSEIQTGYQSYQQKKKKWLNNRLRKLGTKRVYGKASPLQKTANRTYALPSVQEALPIHSISQLTTIRARSSDPFHIVTYYLK